MHTINTKYGPITGTVDVAFYGDGSTAVRLMTDEGPEPISINLAGFGITAPEGQFWVKNYSEHEGMPEAVAEAGIATLTDTVVQFGPFGTTATLMTLNVEA